MLTRTHRTDRPLHLRRTVAMLRVHRTDPTMRVSADELVRSSRTPDGPGTLAVKVFDDGTIEAGAWGPGAAFLLETLPDLLGEHDSLEGFDASLHPAVARAHRRTPGLRFGRTGVVADSLVPTILGQRVTGKEATEAWRSLCRLAGEPAPGPHEGLLLRPEPAWFVAQPDHVYRRLGVERQRTEAIREANRRIDRLEEAAAMPLDEAEQRLRSVRGIGVWTAALIRRVSLGDADAVEVGDYHVPNGVAWALAGEERGTDERMLELLEPWRGHRGRVVRLVKGTIGGAPKRGPRGRISNSATVTRR